MTERWLFFDAASTAFEQMFSTAQDRAVGAEADPWDATVAIPSGDNRVLLEFGLWQGNAPLSVALDPGGLSQALTQVFSDSQSGEVIELRVLLEADMPAAGNYTSRWDWDSARNGARQSICLRGASQTIASGHNSSGTSGAAITATATRASGNFPAGSKIYAWGRGAPSTTITWTVTGDVTEVAERMPGTGANPANDKGVYAEGTVATPASSVTATFTASSSVTRRVAGIVVVEPAV